MKADLIYWDDSGTIEVILLPDTGNIAEKSLLACLEDRKPGVARMNGDSLEIPFRRTRKAKKRLGVAA